jgi:O-antigen/teichoic acid export membrane protein
MSDKNRKKIAINASRDFVFSVLALIIYNGVLQLFIYPGLNDRMGEEAFGTVLYLISIISVMGAGFGTAASYSRMVAKKDRTQANGDYNLFLLTVSAISIGVTAVSLLIIKELKAGLFFPVLILMIVTVFRYYADVEYRMNIRFADYFFFFLMTSLGYCLGLFIYPNTGNWIYTLLIGEVFGIIYTVIRGKIFRPPFFQLSDSYRENYSSAFIISASNLISALILNSDRIFLRLLVGASEVTVFYTASLIGKIVAMLTTPLNGIIISYFTNYRLKITKKVFAAIGGGLIVISALLAVLCSSVSYVFVKFKYPEVLEEARQYFFLANLGQILFFLSGSLMVVVLSFTKEKLQLVINIVYVISFAAVVIPLCLMFGVVGMAYGLVVVNLIRLIVTVIFGLRAL